MAARVHYVSAADTTVAAASAALAAASAITLCVNNLYCISFSSPQLDFTVNMVTVQNC